MIHHPDRNQDNPDKALPKTQEINAARDILINKHTDFDPTWNKGGGRRYKRR